MSLLSRRAALTGAAAFAILLFAGEPAKANSGLVQGSILKVDVAHNQLHVLQPDGKIFVFLKVKQTIVTLNGKPHRFEELPLDVPVTVHFRGQNIAVRIDAVNL